MTPRKRKPKQTLVPTDLATLYALMLREPGAKIQLFRAVDIESMQRRLYNASRDGKLTRHGGPGKGEARWDLAEIHTMFARPKL